MWQPRYQADLGQRAHHSNDSAGLYVRSERGAIRRPQTLTINCSSIGKQELEDAEKKGQDFIEVRLSWRKDVLEASIHWLLTDKIPQYQYSDDEKMKHKELEGDLDPNLAYYAIEFTCYLAGFSDCYGIETLQDLAMELI